MVRRRSRFVTFFTLFGMVFLSFGMLVPQAAAASASAACVTFPETGKQVCDRFLAYWQTNGGLAQQGLPLTDVFDEVNPTDGKTYKTQYFERARFELHPENQAPYDVLLGLLGREQLQAKYGGNPPAGVTDNPLGTTCATFEQTGKKVCGVFLLYWQANGALAQQGLPLSDLFIETNPTDGKPYPTQYFERARFEYHVENLNTPYVVLLGLLGREQLCAKYTACDPTKPPPSPSPSPSPSNVILKDDFSNPASGWPVVKSPGGEVFSEYVNGAYRIAIAAAGYLFFPSDRNPAVANVADARIEADVFQFSKAGESLYGVSCRVSDGGNFYAALTDGLGVVFLVRFQNGKSTIIGIGAPSSLKPGTQGNRLRLDCVGNKLTFYINDQQAA
ncbi:MAG: hypothetical protein U0232_15925, partial [Thermomicrobiales bacterium]